MDVTTQVCSGQSVAGCHEEAPAAAPGAGARGAAGALPPDSHTGAGNTSGKLSASLDWLEATFTRIGLEAVLCLFTPSDCDLSDWTPLPCGRSGYKQGMTRGHIRVFFDGAEGMGVHVWASGEGVRQLEAEGVVSCWEGPEGFAAHLLDHGATFSRVDVAFDDRVGHLTPDRFDGAIREGRCVSRWRQADPRQKISLKDGSTGGWSVYLGNQQSRIRCRFYDKAAEQAEKGCVVDGHWVRAEIQARDERADGIMAVLAAEGLAPIAGLLFRYVDFKEPGSLDSNRARWRTCEWWSDFLNGVQKRALTVATTVQTLERAEAWVKRQVAPTLALLMLSRQHGWDWLLDQVGLGAERLRDWQLAALAPAAAAT